MKKEDFILVELDYETVVDGIQIKIEKDSMNEETLAYANRVQNYYLSKKAEIIEYLLNDSLLNFYKCTYTRDEIIERLNEPDITILSNKWGILSWLNHELDEHIIEAEFCRDLELLYVSIDG